LVGAVASALLSAVDEGFGTLAMAVTVAVSGAWLLVGVVAKGVEVGLRAARRAD
jgi:hypothetical protein